MFNIDWERRQTQPGKAVHTKGNTLGERIVSAPRGVSTQCSCTFRTPSLARAILNHMTRRRFIADASNGNTASLTGDQAAHLARVLRAEPGQIFDVVANGFLHRAEISTVSDREVVFTLHEELEAEAALPVHLLLAVFKFDHLEWGIEKATELGAARITPVLARRTEKHLAQAAAKRVERWRRIVREASQQSRRSDVPEVDDPVSLKAALGMVSAERKLLLAETEQENM